MTTEIILNEDEFDSPIDSSSEKICFKLDSQTEVDFDEYYKTLEKCILSTNKPHISYSELSVWNDCPFKHKLVYIDQVVPPKISPYFTMGTAVHAACEKFLKTKVMDINLALEIIVKDFEDNKDNIEYRKYYSLKDVEKGTDPNSQTFIDNMQKTLEKDLTNVSSILLELIDFMDYTFPNWEYVDAEQFLYEGIEKYKGSYFKGYIDGIIKCKNEKGKETIWILDWKTCQFGWKSEKKQDPMTRNQLVLYKTFYSKKFNIPFKSIKTGFVLLKKTASVGNKCELVTVSVGDTTSNRALKLVDNMIFSIKKGIKIKNKLSCDKWCEFKDTEHCKNQKLHK